MTRRGVRGEMSQRVAKNDDLSELSTGCLIELDDWRDRENERTSVIIQTKLILFPLAVSEFCVVCKGERKEGESEEEISSSSLGGKELAR